MSRSRKLLDNEVLQKKSRRDHPNHDSDEGQNKDITGPCDKVASHCDEVASTADDYIMLNI